MSVKAPLGQFVFFRTPFPRRDSVARLEMTIELARYFKLIDSAAEREAAILKFLEKVLSLYLRHELESITSMLEDAFPKHPQLKGSGDDMFLDAEDAEELVARRARRRPGTQQSSPWARVKAFERSSLAADLLIADPSRERLQWIHIAPGAGFNVSIVERWECEKAAFKSALQRLAQQYFSLDIKQLDCALIDPFLEESRPEEDIWALADVDELTGTPGTADGIMRMRAQHRETLRAKIGDALAPDEATQLKLIEEAFRRIALEAAERNNSLSVNVLRPSRHA